MAAAPPHAILLFYHYEEVSDVAAEVHWQRQLLTELNVGGRLRVAPAGLNGTLSGLRVNLEQYVAAVTARYANGERIDWKFGSATENQLFDALSVRAVDEVVSLGVPGSMAPLSETGRHVSPREFHELLQQASSASASASTKPVVLLDARNVYESRIGHFKAPNVDTLLPPTRQFTDLPTYLDERLEQLRGRTVLMYCTGGVRCESASAYLRHRLISNDDAPSGADVAMTDVSGVGGGDGGDDDGGGDGGDDAPAAAAGTSHPSAFATTEVVQLDGGIERYMEAFPGGGFFRGVNLVFDRRRTTAPPQRLERDVIGQCWMCRAATDDYAPQRRCFHCRLLLLVCPTCCEAHPQGSPTLTCGECDGCLGAAGGRQGGRRQKEKRQVDRYDDESHQPSQSTRSDPAADQPLAATETAGGTPSVVALPQRSNRRMRRTPADAMRAAGTSAVASPTSITPTNVACATAQPSVEEVAHPASTNRQLTEARDLQAGWKLHDAPIKFEYLDHTADVQIHSWGRSVEEAFEQQVIGVMGLITELESVRVPTAPDASGRSADGVGGAGQREVCVEGHDMHSLLYNFLDEWLFQFNAEAFVCKRVKITRFDRTSWTIASEGLGETFELGRHPQGIEVKAITYSALRVTESSERTDVLVIVDI